LQPPAGMRLEANNCRVIVFVSAVRSRRMRVPRTYRFDLYIYDCDCLDDAGLSELPARHTLRRQACVSPTATGKVSRKCETEFWDWETNCLHPRWGRGNLCVHAARRSRERRSYRSSVATATREGHQHRHHLQL